MYFSGCLFDPGLLIDVRSNGRSWVRSSGGKRGESLD